MKIDLNDPIAVLLAATRSLEAAGFQSAAYGGLALAMYGEPRETKDADLAVSGVTIAQADTAFRLSGFDLIRSFDGMRFGGQTVSRLTLVGGVGGSLNTIDLVEPRSPRYAREVQARALYTVLRNQALRVVSPEDFVILKILAPRERDVEDARTVMRALGGRLNISLIEDTLGALASEILDHDVTSRWQTVQRAS
jgi:hypothetical protein